jgi:hypothetical protein
LFIVTSPLRYPLGEGVEGVALGAGDAAREAAFTSLLREE